MAAAEAWFIAGTAVAMAAGAMHVYYALVDTRRPTYFVPVDRSLTAAMAATAMRLGRRYGGDSSSRSVWRVWLGIHIGFGLGILSFALVCLLVALHDFGLVAQIDALRPLTIAFPAAFLVLSLRFFFYVPAIITGTATACFTIAAVLSA